jgi:hypothetical protein
LGATGPGAPPPTAGPVPRAAASDVVAPQATTPARRESPRATRPAAGEREVAAPEAPVRPGRPAGSGHPDVYTAAELAEQTGCAPRLIVELEQYGILSTGVSVGGVAYFDAEALDLARIGARFAELGVEPRHLRTWRNAADREASLFEQLVMPLLRQRNPAARQQAAGRLEELTQLGSDLRAGLIADAVRQIR